MCHLTQMCWYKNKSLKCQCFEYLETKRLRRGHLRSEYWEIKVVYHLYIPLVVTHSRPGPVLCSSKSDGTEKRGPGRVQDGSHHGASDCQGSLEKVEERKGYSRVGRFQHVSWLRRYVLAAQRLTFRTEYRMLENTFFYNRRKTNINAFVLIALVTLRHPVTFIKMYEPINFLCSKSPLHWGTT